LLTRGRLPPAFKDHHPELAVALPRLFEQVNRCEGSGGTSAYDGNRGSSLQSAGTHTSVFHATPPDAIASFPQLGSGRALRIHLCLTIEHRNRFNHIYFMVKAVLIAAIRAEQGPRQSLIT
jgi:hypothetical protein